MALVVLDLCRRRPVFALAGDAEARLAWRHSRRRFVGLPRRSFRRANLPWEYPAVLRKIAQSLRVAWNVSIIKYVLRLAPDYRQHIERRTEFSTICPALRARGNSIPWPRTDALRSTNLAK